MSFVNRELKEDEQREYVLKEKCESYEHSNYIAKFKGGTIDDENDVRMFIYGDAMQSYWSPFWNPDDEDIKYGILDYKGEVIYFTVKLFREGDKLEWNVIEFDAVGNMLEKKEFLKRALVGYKIIGYSLRWNRIEQKDPNYQTPNRKVKEVKVFFD